jgi:hypothetical protein
MQLFTVKMIAKRFISLFDFNGDKTGERLEEIPTVYRDLPLQTAQTYKRQFPDNKVEIEAQVPEPERGGSRTGHKGAAEYAKQPTSWGSKPVVKKHPTPIGVVKHGSTQTAAQTGDMAAAINAEMNK